MEISTKFIKYDDKKCGASWGIIKYDDKQYDARSHATVLSVLVFGPESVSYERSRREIRAKFHEISARVFFEKISKSEDSMIYTISRFFRIPIQKMDSFPMLFSHPTRPPARPSVLDQNWIRTAWVPVFPCSKLDQNDLISSISMFKTGSEWFVFQYFHVQNWLSPLIDPYMIF